MKMFLVLEGSRHDHEAAQMLLQEHGYAVSLRSADLPEAAGVPQRVEPQAHCICDNGHLGIFRSSLDGQLLSINPAGARMFKYNSPQEMIETVNRTSVLEALYVHSSQRLEILAATFSSDDWHVCEEQFRCKGGSVIDCHFHIRAVRDADGRPVEMEGFYEDVGERKQTERALQRTQFTVDKTSEQIFWMTPEGRFFYVNEAACEALGYSRAELEGLAIWDIDPLFSPEKAVDCLRQQNEKDSIRFETLHRAKDGRTYPVEIFSNHINFDGEDYYCAFATDISERKQTEQQLRQASLIVENSPVVLFRWKAQPGWPVEMVTRNVTRFGYTPEELLSGAVPFSSLVHPEDLERVVFEVMDYTRRGAERFQQEYRIVTREGDVRWTDDRTVVERDATGRVTHYQGIVMDITERKQAEEALGMSDCRYRNIVEHAPFGVSRSTLDGRLLSVNPALVAMLKYDSGQELMETVNRSSLHEVLFFDPSAREPHVAKILASDSWQVYNNRLRCKDGSFVDCRVHSRWIVNEDGRTGEFESYQENITDQLAAEQAERESEEQIRASLAEKDVLLREIHHRVKNNLQVMSSLLYLQSQKFSDPELQACLLESQSRICSMALAHEQLYQSKNLAEISVKSYVESLVEQLKQIFQPAGKEVDCQLVVEDLPLDIEKVVPCGLLITELLSNVYKHAFADGCRGQVTISLQRAAGQIELAVADDGVGFPPELDYRRTKTFGLQLVTALVNQLDGTLEMESRNGTRFGVRFAG